MSTVLTEKASTKDSLIILERVFDNIIELDRVEQTMRCVEWSEKQMYGF